MYLKYRDNIYSIQTNRLCNRREISWEFHLNCFVAAVQDYIRRKVQHMRKKLSESPYGT